MIIFRLLLLPFALIYGFITSIRNFLYNIGILKSYTFNIPVISVGNLCMGGTGKTPHCEFLIQNLSNKYSLAYLSRGYKRQSKGVQIIKPDDDVQKAGDEALQIKRKFSHVVVAVCRNRVEGIHKILEDFPQTQIIILDDAYQYRSIKPSFNILLSNFYHLYTKDYLLPMGRLRESRRGYKRADAIIITKTNKVFPLMLKNIIIKELKPLPHQNVFFSYFKYSGFIPAFESKSYRKNQKINKILLFTGIAEPNPLIDHLKSNNLQVEHIAYADHHAYTKDDVIKIIQSYENILGVHKIILTTEKDLMRIKDNEELVSILSSYPVYYIQIEVKFHFKEEQKFLSLISKMIESNIPMRQGYINF
ncbi:MAG TPA: tetraacyldisaccharide 4'-kinase [Bacteroidales bacterium]|nr:tetraacyldisaccharide 4'-kinase [Bacteroidales bacterium]